MTFSRFHLQYVHQGLGDNQFSNTWHFKTEAPIDSTPTGITNGTAVMNCFFNFYDGLYANGVLSRALNYAGTYVKMFDMDAAPGTPPDWQYTFNTNPYATIANDDRSCPWEVAMCLSYEAIAVSGTNRARRRGRVYLGPVHIDMLEFDGFGSCRVSAFTRASVLDAYKTLVDELHAIEAITGPYSKTDNLLFATGTAWIDDAWDTQRRRGMDPSVQTRVDRLPDNSAWV